MRLTWLQSVLAFLGRLPSDDLESKTVPSPDPVPPVVQVDWTLAPDDAVEWVFDARAGRGRWLNGNHTVEEYGIVWEWDPAPSFGATGAMRVRKTEADEAARQAARLGASCPSPSTSSPRPRL